jgi:hypothetical protein
MRITWEVSMRLPDGSWICSTCRVTCALKGYEEGMSASRPKICSHCKEPAEASWLAAEGDKRRLEGSSRKRSRTHCFPRRGVYVGFPLSCRLFSIQVGSRQGCSNQAGRSTMVLPEGLCLQTRGSRGVRNDRIGSMYRLWK